MKKLLSSLLLTTLFLVAGCNLISDGVELKSGNYIYDSKEMAKISDQIKKQSKDQKIVGRIDMNINNFSSKGVKNDGGIRFKTLESSNPEKISEHFFSPPKDWKSQAGTKYDTDILWNLSEVNLDIIPTLVKDADSRLESQKDATGKIYKHKVFVDSQKIQILYKGERKNAEYLADGKGNFIKLEVK